MRPIKQNNSMRELLKKLKRHDTLVLASGVVVATLLCGAFVYVTTPTISATAAQQEVRKDSLGVQKKASDQLNEIQQYLEKLDEVVTNSQSLVENIQTVQNEQKELTEKTLTNEKNNTKENNNNTVSNNSKVVEKISGLDKQLESIHSEISATNEQVKKLGESMKNGGSSDSNKDKESFAQITNALGDLKKTCDKSGTDISGIIEQLKSEKGNKSEAQKEVINNLETIVKSLEKVDTKENLSKLETDLKETQTSYINMLSEVEKDINKTSDNVNKVKDSVSQVDESVKDAINGVGKVGENVQSVEKGVNKVGENVQSAINGVNKVGENVQNAVNGVNEVRKAQENSDSKLTGIDNNISSVNTNVDSLKDSISSLDGKLDANAQQLSALDEQVKAVFQCSDSNRKKLASILSDLCDYHAAEDATFAELIEAVKLIPAHVINSKKVTYEYHKHTDGKSSIAAETCNHSGGCFTVPVKHVHNQNCYKTETVYKYQKVKRIGGTSSSFPSTYSGIDINPSGVCLICTKILYKDDEKNHYHTTTSLDTAKQGDSYSVQGTNKKLICSKNANTVDYYAPGCGFKNGDMERATIEFPKHYTNPNLLATSMVSDFHGLNISEEIFNFDEGEEFMPEDYDAGDETFDENTQDENNENQGEMPQQEQADPSDNTTSEEVPSDNTTPAESTPAPETTNENTDDNSVENTDKNNEVTSEESDDTTAGNNIDNANSDEVTAITASDDTATE